MKKKLLVVFLLLVCFWHFNVKAEGENENISNGSEMTQQERITEDEEDKSSAPKSSDSSDNNGAGTSDLTSPTTLPNDGDSSGETATSSGNTEDGTGIDEGGNTGTTDNNLEGGEGVNNNEPPKPAEPNNEQPKPIAPNGGGNNDSNTSQPNVDKQDET